MCDSMSLSSIKSQQILRQERAEKAENSNNIQSIQDRLRDRHSIHEKQTEKPANLKARRARKTENSDNIQSIHDRQTKHTGKTENSDNIQIRNTDREFSKF